MSNRRFLLALVCFLSGISFFFSAPAFAAEETFADSPLYAPCADTSELPLYGSDIVAEINNNIPFFHVHDLSTESYIKFSELDSLGRAGCAIACIGSDIFPSSSRNSPCTVDPPGWHSTRYDDLISGGYLFNRCHLIAYQLCGDTNHAENLITGTQSMNIDGMLPFENQVYDYISSSGNHVLYRSTPIYHDNDLLPYGLLLEAYSVEDYGKGICFNVLIYNVQAGVEIDYLTGESKLAHVIGSGSPVNSAAPSPTPIPAEVSPSASPLPTYIFNTNSHKFHYPTCSSVSTIKDGNRKEFYGTRDEAISSGYSPCGRCHP